MKILNTEILSKMKVDLNRIYSGFDKVNEDILKIEEIVLRILDGNILEEDICNMYRILTDIEMYIFSEGRYRKFKQRRNI